MSEEITAIVEKIKVGRVDHYQDIMVSFIANMNGMVVLQIVDMKQALTMMEDAGVYDDITNLNGKPCIIIRNGMRCEFKEMWKK